MKARWIAVLIGIVGLLVGCVGPVAMGPLFPNEHHRVGALTTTTAFKPYNVAWGNGSTIQIDQSNTTGCADDGNNCTSSSCGASGVGPCKTYGQVLSRWGTVAPYFTSNTTINFLSGSVDGSDPVIARPITNGSPGGNQGILLTFSTTMTSVSTGTLSGTVAKNRSTPQPLQSTVTSPAINNLVQNTTHASYAWIEVAGTPSTFSQPIGSISFTNGPLGNITGMVENNSWTDGDSYTQWAPQKIVMSHLEPSTTLCLQQEICGIALNNIYILEPAVSNFGDDALYVGQFVWMANVFSERIVKLMTPAYGSDQMASGMVNVGMFGYNGGLGWPNYRSGNLPHGYTIYGGYLRQQSQSCNFAGVFIDFDFHIPSAVSGGPRCSFQGYNYVGAMRVDSSVINMGVVDMKSFVQNGSTNVLWGTGGGGFDNIMGGTTLYPAGASAAAAAFLVTTAPKINGGTVACLGVPSVALPTLTCNKTISATNLDTDLGTTSGCYFVEGSGSICNFGP